LGRATEFLRIMNAMKSKLIVQHEYMIDRYRVVFAYGGGWQCSCAEFNQSNDCKHIRESAGQQAAQRLILNRVRAVNGEIVGFTHRVAHDGTGLFSDSVLPSS
jgi:hypothetical protein